MNRDFWQIINPVSFFTKKTGTFILPAFKMEGIDTIGTSYIVKQFNYNFSKAFSITEVPEQPDNLNFILCIKYRVDETVYRYKLWSPDFDNDEVYVKRYNGEKIRSNFTLEIWNYNNGDSVELEDDETFTTSIKLNKTSLIDDSFIALGEGEAVDDLNPINALPNIPFQPENEAFNYQGLYTFPFREDAPQGVNTVRNGIHAIVYEEMPPGKYELFYIQGAIKKTSTGKYMLGRFQLTSAFDNSVICADFGNETPYDTIEEVEEANFGRVYEAFTITEAQANSIINISIHPLGSEGDTEDSGDNTIFGIRACYEFPLMYSTKVISENNLNK